MASRKYEQPYSSKHVIRDTVDGIRSQEPAYIKNFPRILHQLFRKQTPLSSTILMTLYQPVATDAGNSSSGKSPLTNRVQATSTQSKKFKSNTTSSRKSIRSKSPNQSSKQQQKQQSQPQNEIPQASQQQKQPTGFQTLGGKTTKSQTQMSSVPSDFEHIFHYSETQ